MPSSTASGIKVHDLEIELIAEVGEAGLDPLAFIQRFYPWGQGELANAPGPRKWQAAILRTIRDYLQNKHTRLLPALGAQSRKAE